MPAKFFVRGDLDGFIGLFIDNLLQLMLITSLCPLLCGFDLGFIVTVMLPGAAVSILAGNLFYSWMAYQLHKKTGRDDITALPYGINTPSLIAYITLIMAPVYHATQNAELAWQAGLFACVLSGVVEIAGAFVGDAIRKYTPRAALLSALAGIAITFISMGFVFRIFANPVVALVPALLILFFYTSGLKLIWSIPGGLLAILIGVGLAYLMHCFGQFEFQDFPNLLGFYPPVPAVGKILPFLFEEEGWKYFSVIIPMGLFNVIGSLQNLESAKVAGDSYSTRPALLANGVGTLVAAAFGSPFPTTIYIGHPGWKAMGARMGYSALNGVMIAALCIFGGITIVLKVVPIEATLGILLWIGLIIMAQCYQKTPRRHALAVSIGLMPSFAAWALVLVETSLQVTGTPLIKMMSALTLNGIYIDGLISMSQGFLLTSMILASIMVFLIERRHTIAAFWSFLGAILSATGLIHAYTISEEGISLSLGWWEAPWFVLAYVLIGVLFLVLSKLPRQNPE